MKRSWHVHFSLSLWADLKVTGLVCTLRSVFAFCVAYGSVQSLLFAPTIGAEERGSGGYRGTLKRAAQTEKLSDGKDLPKNILLSLTDRRQGSRNLLDARTEQVCMGLHQQAKPD